MSKNKEEQILLNLFCENYSDKKMMTSLFKRDNQLLENFQKFCKQVPNFNIFQDNILKKVLKTQPKASEIQTIDTKEWIKAIFEIQNIDYFLENFKQNFFKKISFRSDDLSFIYNDYQTDTLDAEDGNILDESRFTGNETITLNDSSEIVINKVNL